MPEGNSIPRAYARGTAVGLDRGVAPEAATVEQLADVERARHYLSPVAEEFIVRSWGRGRPDLTEMMEYRQSRVPGMQEFVGGTARLWYEHLGWHSGKLALVGTLLGEVTYDSVFGLGWHKPSAELTGDRQVVLGRKPRTVHTHFRRDGVDTYQAQLEW